MRESSRYDAFLGCVVHKEKNKEEKYVNVLLRGCSGDTRVACARVTDLGDRGELCAKMWNERTWLCQWMCVRVWIHVVRLHVHTYTWHISELCDLQWQVASAARSVSTPLEVRCLLCVCF